MFVKNKETIDFQYRKGSYLAVLKAGTVSYVDETKVSAKELIDCYGQRIDVVSRDIAVEVAPKVNKEAEVKDKKVETVKKADLDDSFIEKILGEIKEEDTIKAGEDDIIEAGGNDTIEAGEDDTIKDGEDDTIKAGEDDTIKAGEDDKEGTPAKDTKAKADKPKAGRRTKKN